MTATRTAQTAGGRSSTTKGTWSEYENLRAWLLQARKTRRGISDTIAELKHGAAQLAEDAGLGWDHPTVQPYLDDQTGVAFWERQLAIQDREIEGAIARAARQGIILPSTQAHQQQRREQAARLRRNARNPRRRESAQESA